RFLFVLIAGLSALATLAGARSDGAPAPRDATPTSTLEFILGTWTGTSTCVGNRPACKNETLVYRFIPLEGHPGQVRQLADKIVDGKRIPMGSLIFEVDAHGKTVSNEFMRGETHGVWSYTVSGDTMTGSLVRLPERSKSRDVKAHRVSEREVPDAPPLSD